MSNVDHVAPVLVVSRQEVEEEDTSGSVTVLDHLIAD